MMSRETDQRPWGGYEVLLDEAAYKTKRIWVEPGKRLSLQFHRRRDEHWFVVAGRGLVTRSEETIAVTRGSVVDIPAGVAHRIENTGEETVVFIEIQTATISARMI